MTGNRMTDEMDPFFNPRGNVLTVLTLRNLGFSVRDQETAQ